MKLSEVIKAIEDGSKSQFKLGTRNIEFNNRCVNNIFSNCGFDIPLDGWEEVKPPRQWSKKELMLFKLLPDNIKWLARDSNSVVCCYEHKPIKHGTCFTASELETEDSDELHTFDHILTITFEESPIYIGDLKGE